MAKFIQVRQLKNETTQLLREVEDGATVVITRYKKPIATLKIFERSDLEAQSAKYPTSVYDAIRRSIESDQPELRKMTLEERKRDFERLSEKARRRFPFKTWREADAWAKGKTPRWRKK